MGLEETIKTQILNKNFNEVLKKISHTKLYFDFLKNNKASIDSFLNELIFNDNNISEIQINFIANMIDKFHLSFNTDKNYNKKLLTDFKILIFIKFLKNKINLNLRFDNLLNDADIINYEALIFSLFYNKSIRTFRIENYLWDNDDNFSFFENFKNLFIYNKTIKTIIIEGNILKETDLKKLQISLIDNISVEEVQINNSGNGKGDCIRMAYHDFQINVNIMRFLFKFNIFTDLGNERIHFFIETYIENKKVLNLNLYRNKIDDSICNLFFCLEKNREIKKLKFKFENIGEEYFKNIISYLKNNLLLAELDISQNNLNDNCVFYLCDFLKLNKNIKILKLDNNNFGDLGLKILTETLLEHNELIELDLSWNNFSDYGIFYLKEYLIKSQSIEKIYISKERLSEEGVKSIKEAFRQNKNIKKIMLGMSDIIR